MNEKNLEDVEKVKRKGEPDLKDAVRIRSPPRTLLQLSPDKKLLYARCRSADIGDTLEGVGGKYIVIGDVPPGRETQRLNADTVGNEKEKIPTYLSEFVKDPSPEEIQTSQKNDVWILRVGFKQEVNNMEYSYQLTAYRYESTRTEVKPWLIDAMFSKTRFSEKQVRKLAGARPAIAYGFTRWSKTGYLRFHILSAFLEHQT